MQKEMINDFLYFVPCRFGGKEEFMTFMNSFIERGAPSMKGFLHSISVSF